MITLVSSQRNIVVKTGFVQREGTQIFCDVNGNKVLVAEYATEEFAEKVMSEIIQIATKKRVTRHTTEYNTVWEVEEVTRCYTLPAREG